MCTIPLLSRICRESYNDPLEVYATLKRRGMDLVTITDHDSIDAAETLRRHPDFFLSEELSCETPGGNRFHMGVYDITERQHVELQRRRDDFFSLMAYLREQDLFFSLNHMYSGLTGRRTSTDFDLFEYHFPAVETRNGQLLGSLNAAAAAYAERLAIAPVAGSDAHSLSSLGSTSTEVRAARDAHEFLTGLRCGRGVACGESGGYRKLTRAVFEIAGAMMTERKWPLALSPLALFIPLVTLGCWLREIAFGQQWTVSHNVNGARLPRRLSLYP
ncbi:MAG TPA: PHP-associated domain-containing protein [Bryobacteraceae bacterium]